MICLFDLGASFWRNWFGSKLSAHEAFELTIEDIVSHRERYSSLIVCCDSRSKRHDLSPEYKANRPPKPAEAIEALRLVEEQCKALGIRTLKVDGYEADDLIATIATTATETVHITSKDKDLFQLITDRVKIVIAGEEHGEASCIEKFGVPPGQLRDWLAIVGDTADNIRGCPGIGPGKATDLLKKFGSIEAIKSAPVTELRLVPGIGPSATKALLDWDPTLAVQLVTLFTDAPIEAQPTHVKQPAKTTGKTDMITFETGFKKEPLFLVIHGQEGVGKSTFASEAPRPVFADIERKAAVLGVPRKAPKNWDEMNEIVQHLLKQEHDRKTLVIDTIDALEVQLHAWVCAKEGKSSLQDFGFGKGERMAADYWAKFIDSLDQLRFERDMHVIALAHSNIRTFNNPEGADYDRWEMKLDKRAAALFRERSNACLFARYDVAVKTDKSKSIGLSTGSRVLNTEHNAAWDAKNTLGLPEQITLEPPPNGWLNFATHVTAFYAKKTEQTTQAA